jgi:hypothetical protein
MTVKLSNNMWDWINGTALSGTYEELANLTDEDFHQMELDFKGFIENNFRSIESGLSITPIEVVQGINGNYEDTLWITSGLWIRKYIGDDKINNPQKGYDFIYVQDYPEDANKFAISYSLDMADKNLTMATNWDITPFSPTFLDKDFFDKWHPSIPEFECLQTFKVTSLNSSYVMNWPLHDQLEILLDVV